MRKRNPTYLFCNPITLNRYAYVHNSPVNYTDSSGHVIDTLFDAIDLASNVGNCLGDSDALSCYMAPVSLAALLIPGVTTGGGFGDNALRSADDCLFNSFTAGTPVQTENGLVPIEKIEVGDKVLAQDPETGETGYFEVVGLTSHPTDNILRITIDDDSSDLLAPEMMEITPGHPVYVEGKGWVEAENPSILLRASLGVEIGCVEVREVELSNNFSRMDGGNGRIPAKILGVEGQ